MRRRRRLRREGRSPQWSLVVCCSRRGGQVRREERHGHATELRCGAFVRVCWHRWRVRHAGRAHARPRGLSWTRPRGRRAPWGVACPRVLVVRVRRARARPRGLSWRVRAADRLPGLRVHASRWCASARPIWRPGRVRVHASRKESCGASVEVLARAVRGALGLVRPGPAQVLAPSRVEAWRAFDRRGWQGGSFLIRTVW